MAAGAGAAGAGAAAGAAGASISLSRPLISLAIPLRHHHQAMARHQQQMLRQAAEAGRPRREAAAGGGAPSAERGSAGGAGAPPRPPVAYGSAGLTDAAVSRAAPSELVELVLSKGGCARRCLGLDPCAGRDAARKRYLSLALRLHPDKIDHPRAAEAFAAVEAAWRRIDDEPAASPF